MKKKSQTQNSESVKFKVHLEGKDCNTNIISLDDLQNLVAGVNGLSKYVTRQKLGKNIKSKLDKEAREICTLGVKDITKGSAILEIEAYPDGQQKLDENVNTEIIMRETIRLINDFQDDESKIPIELGPYFDSLTKPLNKEESKLVANKTVKTKGSTSRENVKAKR